jgi:GntR family transcriptional regulator
MLLLRRDRSNFDRDVVAVTTTDGAEFGRAIRAMRLGSAGAVRPETLHQRHRRTPDRLNNSARRAYDLLRLTLATKAGDMPLVEAELTDALSASRNTVRAVLQQLAKEGLVTRSPKNGTRATNSLLLRLDELCPVAEFGGENRTTRVEARTLEYQSLGCPRMVRDRLMLPENWTVLMIESLVVQGDEPLGLSVSYIAIGEDQRSPIEVEQADVILFLEQQLRVQIGASRTTIGAVAADAQTAELVGVEVGAPMIWLEDVLQDETGQPRALSQFRLRSDRVAFAASAYRSA